MTRPPIADPLALAQRLWPGVYFYPKQREVIYSVRDNVQTFVPAGNMLGKDFVSAFTILWFFLSRHPVRILTTSADYSQLEAVLWGEIRNFINRSAHALTTDRGGPIHANHLHLRKVDPLKGRGKARPTATATGSSKGQGPEGGDGDLCGISYCIGRVAAKGEGMLGHHAYPDDWDGVTPHTLFVCDEASGVDDMAYERAGSWAKRMLIIGNPYPTTNFFKKNVQAGDLPYDPEHSGSGGT